MQTLVTTLDRAATQPDLAAHKSAVPRYANGGTPNVAALRAATHLVRNSLNTIALCADVLLQPRTTPQQVKDRLELIRRVTNDTTGFLQDLADAVDGDRAVAEQCWITPSNLVVAAVERVRATAGARGVTIVSGTSDPCPAISGDRDKLVRALHAVLAYAVTETGDAAVLIMAEPVAGPPRGVRLRVAFGGSAVPDRAPSLASPLPPGRSREWLMLAVAHATIAAHGGSMSIERTADGSAISVWIPTPTLRPLP